MPRIHGEFYRSKGRQDESIGKHLDKVSKKKRCGVEDMKKGYLGGKGR
jgi:hypothetical protein